MPDDYSATPFLWPNYSTGSALDFDWSGRKKAPKKSPAPNLYGLPMEASQRMENPGISNVNSGAPMQGALPEIMKVPEPVSATDPAFSMHPIMQALGNSAGGVPVPASPFAASWGQLPLSKKPLTRTGLAQALGMPGLSWPQQTQGATIDG